MFVEAEHIPSWRNRQPAAKSGLRQSSGMSYQLSTRMRDKGPGDEAMHDHCLDTLKRPDTQHPGRMPVDGKGVGRAFEEEGWDSVDLLIKQLSRSGDCGS